MIDCCRQDPFSGQMLYLKGFEVRKKSLESHFYEKITNRAGSKHGPCLMNNITNIFVVLHLIVLHNGNNLLKITTALERIFRERSFRLFGTAAIIAFLISEFTIMVGKLSFLLVPDLSLVVSEFFSLALLLKLLTSTSWGVDSVSRMLTSCSFALNVSGRVSHELSR